MMQSDISKKKALMERLSREAINQFVVDGFIKIEEAFSTELAEECRNVLWKATRCNANDATTWTQPVVRLGEKGLEPFKKAANTTILHNAFDQLVGKDKWLPRATLGSFVIRFPSKMPAEDTGWHVDAGFAGKNAHDYLNWRINVNSKGRALLMLFLFSDVSEKDAPTRIKSGSHLDVAKLLQPEGEDGLSFMELAEKLNQLPAHQEILATGKAGTVYLCHPFLVHAAQNHQGISPKFMAQPPLLTKKDFTINQSETELCAVEKAICLGIAR